MRFLKFIKLQRRKRKSFLSISEIKDIKFFQIGNFFNNNKTKSGIFLGKKMNKKIIENSEFHSVAFFENGNENYNYAINMPTLLESWKESAIILDYKSEIYSCTSNAREKMGNKILKMNLNSKLSCKYNPFEEVKMMSRYEIFEIEDIISDIFEEKLLKAEKQSNDFYLDMDYFYFEGAKKLIINIIYYLNYREFLRNPAFAVENDMRLPVSKIKFKDIINFFNDKGKKEKVEEILEILNENMIEKYGKNKETKEYVKNKLDNLNKLYTLPPEIEKNDKLIQEGKLPKIYNFLKLHSDSTLESFFYTAKIVLNDFEKKFTDKDFLNAESDFRLSDLTNFKEPVSLYLSFNSDKDEASKMFYRILLRQFIKKRISYAKNYSHKCLLNLNKASFLGKFEELEDFLLFYSDVNKSCGIKLLMNFTSPEEIKKIYGKNDFILKKCKFKIRKETKGKKILVEANGFKPMLLAPACYGQGCGFKKIFSKFQKKKK